MTSFLAIGECMIELHETGDGLYRRGFAGDTFNTAWYAKRLLPASWRVGYASCIGQDTVSDEMAGFMAQEGIDTCALRRLPDRTVGLYMISLDNGERSFSYWRGQSAARQLASDPDWLDSVLSGADILYFSGITLAILCPDHRRALCDALARARSRGATVAFDTNLRPSLWEDTATMRAGLSLGASVADVVLPSFDEENGLFGDAEPQATIARYHAAGAGIVAVKNGGGDLTLWDGKRLHNLPATPVARVVDSTAAGDSFGAAFMAGLATGASATDAAARAMSLAAQVVQSRGALVPGIFEREPK
ncbi:sugar kinase [Ruegeria pomeroyi]|uniref:2-dehydro-3-deoxygluconokinase n=2 Tax=Ruegeria pomeroyi TaxID=89184 RepID=Q5LQR8_RUEPO|nr:sugar kinase [Ruegeria pomeroyi]AAV95674.1 2-dehydro-3-deoxygluconokinase [Ruegeria pomeroyi DSS-3]NVK99004.1 sugar kinase [Ruegeria pomeroyi]NVL03046.1 sugar kinase [Ruegeria pomeroyi]QWV09260.1 sugar kinase [Ruegeria pomeroyi]